MTVCCLAICWVKPQHFAIMQTLKRDGWGKQYPKLKGLEQSLLKGYSVCHVWKLETVTSRKIELHILWWCLSNFLFKFFQSEEKRFLLFSLTAPWRHPPSPPHLTRPRPGAMALQGSILASGSREVVVEAFSGERKYIPGMKTAMQWIYRMI